MKNNTFGILGVGKIIFGVAFFCVAIPSAITYFRINKSHATAPGQVEQISLYNEEHVLVMFCTYEESCVSEVTQKGKYVVGDSVNVYVTETGKPVGVKEVLYSNFINSFIAGTFLVALGSVLIRFRVKIQKLFDDGVIEEGGM